MKEEIAKKILMQTEQGYDLIAEKFSQTRKRFWGSLEYLKNFVKPGDQVLDYGCGNGRLLELIGQTPDISYIGMDPSAALISIAKNKYQGENVEFSRLDIGQITIPFENEYFNTVYSIAVFHHLPSEKVRKDIATELFRTIKKDGHVVVTVWNLWQKKYLKEIVKNWFLKIIGKSDLDWNDCYIFFTDNRGNKFKRFHYAFTKNSLQQLFESCGFKTHECRIVDNRNIVYIGKRSNR